jgi:ssDNA-binding Zn-finger/Zn-ribbon topoisomerase 1
MGGRLMTTKCNACGATYSSVQADGSRYFHACAPIPNPAFNADPKKGPVDLREIIERPNKRDENISHIDPDTEQAVIKSDGLGVSVIQKGDLL